MTASISSLPLATGTSTDLVAAAAMAAAARLAVHDWGAARSARGDAVRRCRWRGRCSACIVSAWVGEGAVQLPLKCWLGKQVTHSQCDHA
jgi:hypothetical protein